MSSTEKDPETTLATEGEATTPVLAEWLKLIEAIKLNTQAVNYLANVIGFKADEENPKDYEGKSKVKLEAEVSTTVDAASDSTAPATATFDELKDAVNAFAKSAGKEKALALVAKHAGSNALTDVPTNKYAEMIAECE